MNTPGHFGVAVLFFVWQELFCCLLNIRSPPQRKLIRKNVVPFREVHVAAEVLRWSIHVFVVATEDHAVCLHHINELIPLRYAFYLHKILTADSATARRKTVLSGFLNEYKDT